MERLQGKGVFGGAVIGVVRYDRRRDAAVVRRKTDDPAHEKARFAAAKAQAVEALDALYEKACREVGETNAQIFEIHQMMLADADYNESVENLIDTQRVNAEYAVAVASDHFSELFAAMEDSYLQARAADVKDIGNRLIRCLHGEDPAREAADTQPYILCADDLTPSDTVTLDKKKILAFVTKYGSVTSHTAILARTMQIPAVIGVGDVFDASIDGTKAAVDGFTGAVYLDPDAETIAALTQKQAEEEKRRAMLRKLKGKENVTLDGTKIEIYANISGPQDVGAVLLQDAGGIGLFRSEFLYLESEDFPTEQAQFAAYKQVLERMAGKPVIIRTMDIGADKQIGYFGLEHEENPALGYRAIRICLTRQDIFRTQLRALLRASAYGKLHILFPMITSLGELRQIQSILSSVRAELDAEGFPYDPQIPIGVMIETPAAAVISDQLAPEVDFFSVGTNDLIQYTLAVDRQNPKLEPFCDTHHEAVLRLIAFAAQSAHRHGKWIDICGERAAALTLPEHLREIGIDALSVSPPYVLPLRDRVRRVDLKRIS